MSLAMRTLRLDGDSKSGEAVAARLGYVCELLFRCSRRSFPIAALDYWVVPAIQLEQIAIFFDRLGRPVAYATWAFLGDEVAQRMSRDEINVLHLSEWNEGLQLWLIDLVAPYGHVWQVCRELRNILLPHGGEALGIKRDQGESLVRVRRFRGLGKV